MTMTTAMVIYRPQRTLLEQLEEWRFANRTFAELLDDYQRRLFASLAVPAELLIGRATAGV